MIEIKKRADLWSISASGSKRWMVRISHPGLKHMAFIVTANSSAEAIRHPYTKQQVADYALAIRKREDAS